MKIIDDIRRYNIVFYKRFNLVIIGYVGTVIPMTIYSMVVDGFLVGLIVGFIVTANFYLLRLMAFIAEKFVFETFE